MAQSIPADILHDPRESVRGVLGQGFLTSILTGKRFARSTLVLTDRRVYQIGKIFERGVDGRLRSTAGRRVVDLREVTGTSFFEKRSPLLVVCGILGALVALVCLGLMLWLLWLDARRPSWKVRAIVGGHVTGSIRGRSWAQEILLYMGIPCVAFAAMSVWSFVWYRFKRRRYFVIEYEGGAIAIDCYWYDAQEITEFQRRIYQEKDRGAKEGR